MATISAYRSASQYTSIVTNTAMATAYTAFWSAEAAITDALTMMP